MKRKLGLCFSLIFIFLLTLVITPCFAQESFSNEDTPINSGVTTLSKEEMQKADEEHEKRYAEILELVEERKNVDSDNDISPQWYYEVEKILRVPHHIQQTDYWCGPASILQIIDFNGKAGNVSGNNEYSKQKTLADESGTVTAGANTLNLRNTLNKYLSHYFNVTAISSSKHYDTLWNIIDNNIFYDKQPVLVLVNTKYLPYYNGRTSYHYVVVDGMKKVIDDSTSKPVKSASTVRIVDPHYSSSYTGYHTVYFNDLYNAAKGYYECSNPQAYNISY